MVGTFEILVELMVETFEILVELMVIEEDLA